MSERPDPEKQRPPRRPAPPAVPARRERMSEALSLEEFRSHIEQSFRATGVAGDVKAELRRRLVDSLRGDGGPAQLALAPARALPLPLATRAAHSLVLQYLQSLGLEQSAAVLAPECGVEEGAQLSVSDALTALGASGGSRLSRRASGLPDRAAAAQDTALGLILSEVGTWARQGLRSSSTQTRSSTWTAREALTAQLDALDRSFARRGAPDPGASAEQRMCAFQQEVEARARSEVAREVQKFRETALRSAEREMRLEKTRALEALRAELRREHEERLRAARTHEAAAVARLESGNAALEQANFEARQKFLNAMDRVRTREREAARARELEAAALRQREARVLEGESALAERISKVERRERDVDILERDAATNGRAAAEARYESRLAALEAERAAMGDARESLARERAAILAQRGLVDGLRAESEDAKRQLAESQSELRDARQRLRALGAEAEELRSELSAREDQSLAAAAAAAQLPMSVVGEGLATNGLSPLMISKVSLLAMRAQSERRAEELSGQLLAAQAAARDDVARLEEQLGALRSAREGDWRRAQALQSELEALQRSESALRSSAAEAQSAERAAAIECAALQSENERLSAIVARLQSQRAKDRPPPTPPPAPPPPRPRRRASRPTRPCAARSPAARRRWPRKIAARRHWPRKIAAKFHWPRGRTPPRRWPPRRCARRSRRSRGRCAACAAAARSSA